MKRKYAAMMLGLVLTISSMNVAYATESTDSAESIIENVAEDADSLDSAENETVDAEEENEIQEIYGEVKEISDDAVTISLAELKVPAELEETETAEEQDAAAVDDSEGEDEIILNEELPEEAKAPLELKLTGEEQTIAITENTLFEKEVKPDEESDAVDAEVNVEADADTEIDNTAEAEQAEGETSDDEAEAEMILVEEVFEMEAESVDPAEIKAGDVVKVILDADGNAEKIVVLNAEIEKPEEGISEENAAEDNVIDADTAEYSDTADTTRSENEEKSTEAE